MALQNKKSLGQHWLKNRAVLDEIAGLASDGASTPSLVLEIGPGLGTLTAALFRKFDRVIVVEIDKDLATKLPGSFPGKNLEVVNEDFLKFDLNSVPAPYAVAGNIPYYITGLIVDKLLMAENRPERIVLLVQKEVAERMADRKETILSLKCKNRAKVELGPVVLRGEFTPPPEVDSQVVILTPHDPIVSDEVMKFIQTGFGQPRKKVTRNLSVYLPRDDIKDIFIKMNLNIDVRPHELHLEDWQRVYEKLEPFIKKTKKVV